MGVRVDIPKRLKYFGMGFVGGQITLLMRKQAKRFHEARCDKFVKKLYSKVKQKNSKLK